MSNMAYGKMTNIMNQETLPRSRSFDNSSKVFRYKEGRRLPAIELHKALTESGFAIVTGLPVEEHTSDEDRIAATTKFLNKLTFLGVSLKQNTEGARVWLVRNEGSKVEPNSSAGQRISSGKSSKSDSDLGMHNDAAAEWHGHKIETIALVAFAQAPQGGETTLVDAREAFELLDEENPRAARVLTDTTFYFDRSSGHDADQLPYSQGPIIDLSEGFRVRYTTRIYQGFEVAGQTPSQDQRTALAAWDQILNRPELHIKFKLEAGDVLLLNENVMLHGRTSFTDDPKNPRTLTRSWLSNLYSRIPVG
jgi:hypothetical protein